MTVDNGKFTKKDIKWLRMTIHDCRSWGYNKVADMLCENLKEAETSDEE